MGIGPESKERTVAESKPTVETARLGMWDAVSIIVGIVVGASIYKTPQMIFANADGPWLGLSAWALGGLLSFVGALCYAELATAYPRMGGDYVYLSRAYGSWVGFLFGWAQLAVILTGSIGAMAYVFGDYAYKLWNDRLVEESIVWFAALSVAALSLLNLAGVVFGKWMQNVLTVAKVLGLLAIVVAGIGWGTGEGFQPEQIVENKDASFGLAMVFVLYAFGGWNDCAFVASEVKDRRRDIPKALFLGIAGITAVYLVVNVAFLWGLGFDGVRNSGAPAADVLQGPFGENGVKVMSILVMLSALGALNGLIFTGARIYTALGREHSVFAVLGRWDPRLGVPLWSILAQAAVSLMLILAVGTEAGRNAIDSSLQAVGRDPLPWNTYFGGFETLVAGTAPVFWLFFLLTGVSLFVLRLKDPGIDRPFKTPLYPVVPLIFCGTCGYMLYSSLAYAKGLTVIGFVPLAIGLPLYFLSRRTENPEG